MTNYNAPALEKGLDILEFLSAKIVPQTQTEIALGLNRKQSEIYRMLVCLDQRGYIKRDEVSNKFSLSLKLYQLSHRHSPLDALRKAAYYPMQLLSEQISQSCHLSILNQGKVMVMTQNLGPTPISLSIQEGNLFPISQITSGRIILSILEQEESEKILNSDSFYNKLSSSQQNKIVTEIKDIKKNGFIISESEITKGVVDYAIPIGGYSLGFYGSLAVTTLSGQQQESAEDEFIIDKIKFAKNSIYTELGTSE